MRLSYLRLLPLLGGILMAGAGCQPKVPHPEQLIAAGQKYDVKILRDTWGVPHIFGKTDEDTAYGLAYANAEDDFKTVFEGLLAVRGRLSTVKGQKDKAPFIDLMVSALRVWDKVNAGYDTDLSPKMRAICEAYADGVNHYAALHPDEVIASGIIPTNGKDIIAGFVLKAPLFYGLDNQLEKILEPPKAKKVEKADSGEAFFPVDQEIGSNTFAVSPKLSADGWTRLAVNSHQPWDGPVAWFEAHVHSEEGWDCIGGLFPGTPVILGGHNRNLGWAHTVNHPDVADIYELTINPDDPFQYQMDGQWHDLEVRRAWIWIKLLGPVSVPIPYQCLWSKHHGPVIRCIKGTFALRYGGMDDIRQVEQWYRMNKAANLKEFQDALRMRAIASFNVGYADREGNIYYLYNADIPKRAEGYNWQDILPGNTSKTLWSELIPFEQLPQVLNPQSGYVQNCNSDPCYTTVGPDNPKREALSPTYGIETDMTNRALRANELFGTDDAITREEFYTYKNDIKYSKDSIAGEVLKDIEALPPQADPVVQAAIDTIKKWDFSTDAENLCAAIAASVLFPVGKARFFREPEPDILEVITKTAHQFQEVYGTMEVPWSKVMRLRRGNVNLGLTGGPDTLRAIYWGKDKLDSNGCLYANTGDSYVLMVEWDKEGKVHSESIHQYGSATTRPESPHYADQAPLFAALQYKPVWFDEADIRAHLEREYRPGS